MAIDYVLEAACGVQEVYSLPEVSLLSNVTWSFYIHAFFFLVIMKNGVLLDSRRILATETNMGV